jgi:CubicO group peptidase (beta-lactamase class C family)
MNTKSLKVFSSLLLALSLFTVSLPAGAYAQAPAAVYASQDEKALAAIEAKVEARRKELGIPGMSLVIVKDDKVIYMKGLGFKDFEKKIVVTPDTQFAIGSATKAFTALSVLMSQDEGKLSLEDSPKKYLPYFKMYDPDADKAITIRDLLSHRSGLNRTDLAMITGRLNRAELIQVAAQAKPTAKLGEKFQYQNIMYTAAGEIVTQVQGKPWESFVPERIFKPLGMTNSSMLIREMEKVKDYSYGYTYNFDTKETVKRPFREIEQVAPAGSINSSARDMAQWLRFVLNVGSVNGKRLVSEKSFAEWVKPQMKIAGSTDYGLGWFLQDWKGHKVVQHGGNIDGFNSLVAMVPEKKLGFVMLTNVSASSLGADIMPVIFENLIEMPKPDSAKMSPDALKMLVGKYGTAERAVEVKLDGDHLVMIVPGQPPYKLNPAAGRQFKPEGLPDDFAAKFSPETGEASALELIQPQGNRKLPRLGAEPAAPAAPAAARELVGKYTGPGGGTVEISEAAGVISFNIPGQQPYNLAPKPDGSFSMSPLPEAYFLTPKRDGGRIAAVAVTQPEGVFEFKRSGDTAAKPSITVDELHAKAINAIGGEAAIRKVTTRVTEVDINMESQGVQGTAISWAKAPNKNASETTLTALGKKIASLWEYFDGTSGMDIMSFAPSEKYEGKRLEDVRLGSDLYGSLDWKTNFTTVEVTGTAKVNGEDAYVVSFVPKAGTPFKEYYSTATFLMLRRQGVVSSSTSADQLPYTVTYSDFREVDGLKLPFKTVNSSPSNGTTVGTVKSIKHNVPVDDKIFAPRKVD